MTWTAEPLWQFFTGLGVSLELGPEIDALKAQMKEIPYHKSPRRFQKFMPSYRWRETIRGGR